MRVGLPSNPSPNRERSGREGYSSGERCQTSARQERNDGRTRYTSKSLPEIVSPTWVGRPSLKSYEDSIFALYTLCTAIFILREDWRALPRLINAYFAGINAVTSRKSAASGKSGFGTILRAFYEPVRALDLREPTLGFSSSKTRFQRVPIYLRRRVASDSNSASVAGALINPCSRRCAEGAATAKKERAP